MERKNQLIINDDGSATFGPREYGMDESTSWDMGRIAYNAAMKKTMAEHHGIQWVSHHVPNADGTDECRDAQRDVVAQKLDGLTDREIYDSAIKWNKENPCAPTGWSSSYYELPEGAEELQDLIEYREMNFALGNIFKACYRMGDKAGTSEVYDLNKIVFYAQRELRRIENEDRPGNSTS